MMQEMTRLYVQVLVLFLGLLVFGSARKPGFKARVTTKGLNYAIAALVKSVKRTTIPNHSGSASGFKYSITNFRDHSITVEFAKRCHIVIHPPNDVAIAALVKSVKQTTIPDQSGSASGITYSITNIRVTDFNLPVSTIGLVPGSGLSWKASNAHIAVHGNFRYKKWFIRGSGSFDAKVEGVSFGIEIDLGVDTNGRPSIQTKNCGSSIGNVDFRFHGRMAWLYNLFRHKVGNVIKKTLDNQMCKLIVKQINEDGVAKLAKLKVTTTLATNFLLDYRLIQTPIIQPQFIETAHKGQIYWASEPTQECPFTPPVMPENGDTSTSSMLYLFVSDYLFNSLGYNAQKHGLLTFSVTQKDLPPGSRGVLDTTCDGFGCIGKLIPQIGEKYPNMNVELRMNSTMAPRMNITSQGVNVTFQGMIDLYARKDGISDTPFLISLLANMETSVNVLIQNELVYGEINTLTLKLKVITSAVGEVPDLFLEFLINQALKMYFIPQLNELGKKGFPLPLTGDIMFNNTKLSFAQHTIIIGTDLKYQPTTKVNDFAGVLKFHPYYVNLIA